MQTQDFYKLERSVQDRLIGCLNGTGLPSPTLALRGGPMEPVVWLLGAGACAVGLVVLYRAGLGALGTPLAIQAFPFLIAYAVLLSGIAFALVRAAAVTHDVRSLPFKPGIYLFPIGVIDARRHVLKIYSVDELVSSEGPSPSHAFKLVFRGGGTFEFRAKNAEIAAKAAESIAGSRGQIAAAEGQPGSMRPRAMASLDPLQGFVNPLAPTTSIARTVPVWAKLAWAIAPAVGLVLGSCLFLVRNLVSDDRMFAAAVDAGDAASLRAYLARGSRHKDEVQIVLLPRVELKEAKAKGSVDAIEAYIKEHPKTGIGPEIEKALRAAMADELQSAIKVGTVTALKDFAQKHPNHHLEGDLKAAMHAVYAAAFEKYRDTEAPKDAATLAFVEKLVAWAEAHGPKVEIRIHRKASHSLDKAEAAIAKNRYFMGNMSFPAQYHNGAHMKAHEDDVTSAVIARFNAAFPSDVLAMETGALVDDPEGSLPDKVTVPTLFLEWFVDWDGALRTNDRPRGVFVGVGYVFESTFRLPDDTKALKYKPKGAIWRAPHLDGLDPDVHPEEKLYADMATSAFDELKKKLVASMFVMKAQAPAP